MHLEEKEKLCNIYQAGMLSGNSICVSTGLSTLKYVNSKKEVIYSSINEKTKNFYEYLKKIARKRKITITVNSVDSMFTIFFADGPVKNYEDAKRADTKKYAKFFHEMLKNGIYFAPSDLEANFFHSYIKILKNFKSSRNGCK